MFMAIVQAVMLAFFGTVLILIDVAFTPILGGIFCLVAGAVVINAMNDDEVKSKAEPEVEVVVEKASEKDDLYRNVHFSGRTGSDLVDPRERPLSSDELEKIIQNAQKALRAKGRNINSITVPRV